MGAPVKSCSSCTVVQVTLSTSDPPAPGALLWVELVAVAALWWGLLGDAAVGTWLREARAWLGGAGSLEGVCVSAARAEGLGAWPVAWAVRAATCALAREARASGRWPAWRSLPFAVSGYEHPAGLAREVLFAAAEVGGVEASEVERVWRELAAGEVVRVRVVEVRHRARRGRR